METTGAVDGNSLAGPGSLAALHAIAYQRLKREDA